MKKVYIFIALIVLFLLSIDIWLIKQIHDKNQETKNLAAAYSASQANITQNTVAITTQILSYQKLDGKKINDVTLKIRNVVQELDGRKLGLVRLSQLLKPGMVVFRFFQTSCGSCVTEQLGMLNILQKKMGKEKVLILTDRLNEEVAYFIINRKYDFNIYETENAQQIADYDNEQIPYLFVTDIRGLINSAIIITPQSKIYSYVFYDNLSDKIN